MTHQGERYRAITALLALFLIITASTLPVVATSPQLNHRPAMSPQAVGDVTPSPARNTSDNESRTQHRNPRDISQPGDLGILQGWLSRHMGEVLIDCTNGLKMGTYDLCNRVDGDYPDWLSRYIELTDETTTQRDNTASPAFSNANRHVQNFSSDVRQFRQTYRKYQQARTQGNVTRARRLARQLVSTARRINTTGTALVGDYQTITNTTAVDLSEASRTVTTITTNITTIATTIERDLFAATTLTATVRTEQISFLQPLHVTGQLTTRNGTALANRHIRLQIDSHAISTTTNATGGFTFTYRPTVLSLGTETATVHYLPANTSKYRGAATTLSVEVKQVTPNLTLTTDPTTAGFAERVTVTGAVSAHDINATDVPVLIRVAGHRIDRVQTTDTGRFTATFRIPATLSAGTQTIRATIPLDNRTLARTSATAPLTITTTPTQLSVTATQLAARRLRVTSRLTTQTGTPIGGQTVTLWVNDTKSGTVTTGSNGRFSTIVTPPQSLLDTEEPNVTVAIATTFDGQGTNLEPSRNETVVVMSLPPEGSGAGDNGIIGKITHPIATVQQSGEAVADAASEIGALLPWWQWLVLLAGGSLLITGLFVFRTRIVSHIQAVSRYLPTAYVPPAVAVLASWVRSYLWFVPWWISRLGAGILYPLRRLLERFHASESSPPPVGENPTAATDNGETKSRNKPSPEPTSPLAPAQDHLGANNPTTAITTAYVGIRQQLSETLNPPPALTHWEFFNVCRQNGVDQDRLVALQRLTEAYEQAAFAPTPADTETATDAMDAANTLLASTDQPG